MFQRDCRLLRASRYYGGGGGGGTDVNQSPGGFRFWGGPNRGEQQDIKKGFDFNIGEFNNYVANNPLLKAAQGGSLSFSDQLPGMLSQFPGFQKELSGYQNQIGGYQNQLGTYGNQLGKIQQNIPSQFSGYQHQLGGLYNKLGTQANTLG